MIDKLIRRLTVIGATATLVAPQCVFAVEKHIERLGGTLGMPFSATFTYERLQPPSERQVRIWQEKVEGAGLALNKQQDQIRLANELFPESTRLRISVRLADLLTYHVVGDVKYLPWSNEEKSFTLLDGQDRFVQNSTEYWESFGSDESLIQRDPAIKFWDLPRALEPLNSFRFFSSGQALLGR